MDSGPPGPEKLLFPYESSLDPSGYLS